MKKILILLSVILLCGCAAKREEYFLLSFDGNNVAVGYDGAETVEYLDGVDSYECYTDKDERQIIKKIVIYTDDLDDRQITLDGRPVPENIDQSCKEFDGTYSDDMGHSCIIAKEVKGIKTYAILYGDILADDSDLLDRIEVYFDK